MKLQMKVNIPYTYDKVIELYNKSFSRKERKARRSFEELVKKIDSEEGELTTYYIKKQFVGFTYIYFFKDIRYLYCYAVSPECRNRGYGTTMLKYLKMKYRNSKFILADKALTEKGEKEAERTRRLAFYEKNGFSKSKYIINENKILYQIFYVVNQVTPAEYMNMIRSMLNDKKKKHFKLEEYTA